MTDQQRAEAKARLLGGYTEEQLSSTFDRVKNPTDWKAPIRAQIPLAEFNGPLVKFAIEFYTATTPTFIPLMVSTGTTVLVTADGYRRGPAGDH